MADWSSEYIVIKALENGVTIMGLTRGRDTKFHHTEKLDKGEVMVAQFTENTAAIKLRGRAEVLTKYGMISTYDDGRSEIVSRHGSMSTGDDSVRD